MSIVNFASVTIDSAGRTAIPAQVDCTVVQVRNTDLTNDATIYDAATGGTGVTLAAGSSRTFRPQPGRAVTWHANDTVVWAQAAAGTGPIEVECLR